MDGADFWIYEPSPYTKEASKDWYSHKYNGPGLRYEIGVSIRGGWIVWINGPFQCGKWMDILIFRKGLQHFLGEYERVEVDSGYAGADPEFAKTPSSLYPPS